MKFIKLTLEDDMDLWIDVEKIESIEALQEKKIEVVELQCGITEDSDQWIPTQITMDSGEQHLVRETAKEIFTHIGVGIPNYR